MATVWAQMLSDPAVIHKEWNAAARNTADDHAAARSPLPRRYLLLWLRGHLLLAVDAEHSTAFFLGASHDVELAVYLVLGATVSSLVRVLILVLHNDRSVVNSG